MSLTCDEVQLALVDDERDERVEAHLRECPRCRGQDLRMLARLADGPAPKPRPGPLGEALETFLQERLESREPVYGRYRLLERLGSGGQGVVYRAEDHEYPERPRQVALKFVRTDAREAAFALEVQHPNVCRIFHTELKDGGVRLILMEYVGGGTLARRMDQLGRAGKIRCFRRICLGVEAAHRRKILHLDLKPQNVLLREGGEPAVTDFGLAGALDASGRGRSIGGTRRWMAPEQRRRLDVDGRADVYALGRILRALIGKRRWSPYRWIANRATRWRPEERFQSVASMRRAVDAVRLGGRVAAALVAAAILSVPAARAFERWRGCGPGFDEGRMADRAYQQCVRTLPAGRRDPLLLEVARALDAEFARVTRPERVGSPPRMAPADLARTSALADFLLEIDPVNGHGLSYAGQVPRWLNAQDRTGEAYLRSHERFFQYLGHEASLPPSERDGPKARCMERASGYCAERTNWMLQLMANDNYRVACRSPAADHRRTALERALRQVREEIDREGSFDDEGQGVVPRLLRRKIESELARPAGTTGCLPSVDPP